MAKIRAYKLAEELGIERGEFVERAREAGVDLKTAMVLIDEEDVDKLRKKLTQAKPTQSVVERRVEAGGGGAVIRRRKKAVEEAPPVVEPPAIEPSATEAPAPASASAATDSVEDALTPREADAVEPRAEPAPTRVAAEKGESSAVAARDKGPREGHVAERSSEVGSSSGAGGGSAADAARRGRERQRVREVVNLREQENLARQAVSRAPLRRQVTLEPQAVVAPRRRRRDAAQPKSASAAKAEPRTERRVLRIEGAISVGDLARLLGEKAPAVQSKLMALGTMVAINQSIPFETAATVAAQFGYSVQDTAFNEQEFLQRGEAKDESWPTRAPVVTVMGHVDHGKTSLLDALRRSNVVEGEAGGITQHIGAYRVEVGGRAVAFIDTPGHAAFTEMRARGAQVTDIVILVVAATEGIMPQTIEAIEHARSAGVPIVVAINKCDLPGADSRTTRQRLMEHGLVPEDFGGDVICVDVSAKTGTGLEQLLEMLHLQADVLELRARTTGRAHGTVLEARLDRGRGPIATVLVQSGKLESGDIVVVGTESGRVRAMEDDRGRRVSEAGPSTPVQVIGLSGVPRAGDALDVVESERVAKEIVANRLSQGRQAAAPESGVRTLEDLFAAGGEGGVKELRLIVKADVQGSVEALREALLDLSTDAVKVDVIRSGVGAVSESDVMLARASSAIVVAFHVRPDPVARRTAESHGVEIRTYQIIYEVTEDIERAMLGLLPPTRHEVFLGRAEVRETFNVPRIGTIAGCYVSEGLMRRNTLARLLRDGVQVYEGRIGSLKRFKDDVREVASSFECGIGIEGYNDIKVGDVIEAYVVEEKPATLG